MLEEPVDKWQKVGGKNLLVSFKKTFNLIMSYCWGEGGVSFKKTFNLIMSVLTLILFNLKHLGRFKNDLFVFFPWKGIILH